MLHHKETYTEFIESEYYCRTSLYEYVKRVWPLMEGSDFVDNFHIGALCEHLEAVSRRDIRKIIVNLPPRTTKTSIIMAIWPTWVWINEPQAQFLCVSNGDGLAKKSASSSLSILSAQFYQKRWGRNFHLSKTQKEKKFFTNSKHGYRLATTTHSTVIGRGGDFIFADDFNSPYESPSEQNRIVEFWKGTLFNRANNPKTACWIVLAQRTGKKDLTANLLEEEGWVHFYLPMEYDSMRPCKTIILPSTAPNVWQDPRKKDGELLWPERFDDKYIRAMKASVGTHIYAGQYQQSPRDEEGGLILRAWWQLWKESYRPKLSYIIQSWDTALTDKQSSDFSACTTWGVFDRNGIPNLILLSAWKGRVRGPELLRRAIRLKNNYLDTGDEKRESNSKYSPDIVIVEEKSAGYGLVSDLIERGIPAHGFNPGTDCKTARVNRASPYIECGFVWVPTIPPSFDALRKEAEMVVDNCALFPNGDNDDIVDTVSQAILYLKDKGILRHIEEIMYFKDELDDENLPGFKKEGEKEFVELVKKQHMTKERIGLSIGDPFDYMMTWHENEKNPNKEKKVK